MNEPNLPLTCLNGLSLLLLYGLPPSSCHLLTPELPPLSFLLFVLEHSPPPLQYDAAEMAPHARMMDSGHL
jgi:hypothetical protein